MSKKRRGCVDDWHKRSEASVCKVDQVLGSSWEQTPLSRGPPTPNHEHGGVESSVCCGVVNTMEALACGYERCNFSALEVYIYTYISFDG